jgi:hypothetical protein
MCLPRIALVKLQTALIAPHRLIDIILGQSPYLVTFLIVVRKALQDLVNGINAIRELCTPDA